jgi:hypothetical protein
MFPILSSELKGRISSWPTYIDIGPVDNLFWHVWWYHISSWPTYIDIGPVDNLFWHVWWYQSIIQDSCHCTWSWLTRHQLVYG